MHRAFTMGIRCLCAEYLFALAHLCHTPPGEVRRMRVWEFAVLIDGCDTLIAARREG